MNVAEASGAQLARGIEKYLRPLLETNNFSGVILVAKGDEILFHKGYGQASIEHQVPNSPTTAFQIASVSKPFTAAAIMRLAEQGKIDLHKPISAILADFPNGDRLTVHHLLTHMSGIPNINDFPDYDILQLTPHSAADLVDRFKDKELEFEPGSRFSYSNSNYNLLALIIEKASGSDYGTFLKSTIFDPLQLGRTGHLRSQAQIVPGIATGYAPSGSLGLERAAAIDWSVKTGNGSLYSDARDVWRFMRAVHSGRLLTPASRASTFTQHSPNIGYGWFLTRANNRPLHHSNGRSPGFAAQADYYPADDVAVIVLANTYVSVTSDIARAVGALHFGEPVKPMPSLSASPLSTTEIAALVGDYRFGPDYYVPNALVQVRANDGHLVAMVDGQGPFPMVRVSPTKFILRSFWVSADFVVSDGARAQEFVIDGLKGSRVSNR